MVPIPAGTFDMGAPGATDDRGPVHSETVAAFCMDRLEVTTADYRACVAQGRCQPTSGPGTCNETEAGHDQHPINCVSYPQAEAYCQQRGARLPTEAEWEYAARGGVHNADNYRYSGGQTLGDVAWYGDNAPVASEAVGGRLPNQLGLYDMSGNLYEFCWDWYGEGYYAACNALGTVTDPLGAASGDMRVVRGGDWSGVAANCRVAGRFRDYPVSGFSHTGFRVARGH
jgi:formylglycine-generating enzyme required for sulfatase activity